jgi:hypothetical protein
MQKASPADGGHAFLIVGYDQSGFIIHNHLTDSAEQKDPTCKQILGYSRSLLYLVSESFEKGVRTPILGMEKYIDALAPPRTETFLAPGSATASTTHGDFDNDAQTMLSVIGKIRPGS